MSLEPVIGSLTLAVLYAAVRHTIPHGASAKGGLMFALGALLVGSLTLLALGLGAWP